MRGDGKKIHSYLLTGGALLPEIPPGVTVRCAVREPRSGDFVVYLPNEGGEPIFRRYAEKENGMILLESLNSRFDSFFAKKTELLARGTLQVILSFSRTFYESTSPVRITGEDGLLTFTEAAKLLKIGRTRMYAMLRSGELPAVKMGKLWRIRRSDLGSCLSELPDQLQRIPSSDGSSSRR